MGDHPSRMCCTHTTFESSWTNTGAPSFFSSSPPSSLTFPTNRSFRNRRLSLSLFSPLPPVLGYSLRRKRDLSSTFPLSFLLLLLQEVLFSSLLAHSLSNEICRRRRRRKRWRRYKAFAETREELSIPSLHSLAFLSFCIAR